MSMLQQSHAMLLITRSLMQISLPISKGSIIKLIIHLILIVQISFPSAFIMEGGSRLVDIMLGVPIHSITYTILGHQAYAMVLVDRGRLQMISINLVQLIQTESSLFL